MANNRAAKAKATVAKRKAAAKAKAFRTGVSSTCLRRVEHDGESTLKVEFRRGSVYAYYGVSKRSATALARAGSVGKSYNRNIKPYYAYSRLRAAASRKRGAKGKR